MDVHRKSRSSEVEEPVDQKISVYLLAFDNIHIRNTELSFEFLDKRLMTKYGAKSFRIFLDFANCK